MESGAKVAYPEGARIGQPAGALSVSNEMLAGAANMLVEAVDDLGQLLDGLGLLRSDHPHEAASNVTRPGDVADASPHADFVGSQASRVMSATAQLRHLWERIDR
jgi:hypothetical protein